MSAYGALARYYDLFTRPADCERMGRKYLRLLRQSGAESGLLLDLCCGTGSLSLFFAGQGFDVTGVDASQDMLSAAKDKAEAAGVELLLVHQRLERLDLYGTYDAAVCALDGINHLPSLKAVDAAFARIALFLRPGAPFVFDLHTERRFTEDYGQSAYTLETEDVYCVWQNDYDPRAHRNKASFALFERRRDGLYIRYDDTVIERYFAPEEVCERLSAHGFRITGVYGQSASRRPTPADKRVFIAARRL